MQGLDTTLRIIIYFFIIILGILTIFYQLNFDDLWLDEMASFWIADPALSHSETIGQKLWLAQSNFVQYNS